MKTLDLPKDLDSSWEHYLEVYNKIKNHRNSKSQEIGYETVLEETKPWLKEFSDIYYVRISTICKNHGKKPPRYRLWRLDEVMRFKLPMFSK